MLCKVCDAAFSLFDIDEHFNYKVDSGDQRIGISNASFRQPSIYR
jgi:hypothetical protein